MRRRAIANRTVPRRTAPGSRASAALVAGGYAVVGCAWVLLSDTILRVLAPGRTGELVGSVKGIGFIVVTTIVLWGVLAARDHLLARSERERIAAVEATSSIFDSSPLAIVSVDRAGLITAWSPAAERVLGWAADEVVGRPATILRPDDPAWISRGFAEVLAGETLVAVPVRYPHRDGRARDLELFAAPLRDERGAVRGAVVVAEDLTETHEAQADRARLATAIDQAAEAIVVTDPRGTIVYVNPAFEQVTGYDRAALMGQNPRLLKSGVQDAAFYERMWATLLAGRTWRGTLVNRRRDGSLFEEEAAISPVRDAAGTTTAFVAVKRDLTVERALEAGLRAEILDRVAVREAIGRIRAGTTPEATAASVVEALREIDGLDYPSVFHLPARPGAVVRLAGRLPGAVVTPGEEIPDERAAYLRERAADGPWVHVFAREPAPGGTAIAIVSAGGITGGIYAPVVHEGRVVGVVGGVTTRADPAATLGRRLGSLLEVAAFVGPLLGPQLVDRDDLDGARASMATRAGAPGQSTRWCSTAHSAACVREASPSLPRMLET